MSRIALFAAIALLGGSAAAQVPGAAAKAAARKAVAATNAHTAAEQAVEDPPQTVRLQGAPAAHLPTPHAAAAANVPKPVATVAKADTIPPDAIERELFEYPLDGRRDPFVSLLTTSELRPAMSDLRLTGILVDNSGGDHSVATLRDISNGGNNKLYRVSVGSVLGRMRVSAIRLKTIVFTIDEFGTPRDDSLVLGDSTKVRDK